MIAQRIHSGLAAVLLLTSAACADSGSSAAPAAIAQLSGNNRVGSAGIQLPEPLVVQVTGADGQPIGNATVNWAVTSGSGTVNPVSSVTGADGSARTNLTFGPEATSVIVTASVSGTSLTARFIEFAQPASGDCTSATASLPAAGSVNLSLQATSLCLDGGSAGADFALIAFNTSKDALSNATVSATGQGITPLASPDARPAALVPVRLSGGLEIAAARRYREDAAFETRLREREAAAIPSRVAGARAWMRQQSTAALLRDAIPATVHVGDLLRLNANSNELCDDPDMRTGRVVAVGQAAIVVADTSNPAGGFTDADYKSFAAQFDTLVNPLDTAAFGEPTDIDHNGRELIFFTRAVNELIAPASGTIIGGFFISRDLVPPSECAASNFGEMFYMLVPDPQGTVNGNDFTVADVEQTTTATLAHEYQHLINASRRLYVNNAPASAVNEVIWLNEGLSHIAEELLFYRESGLAPRQNITLTALRQQGRYIDAFSTAQNANRARYEDYLDSPQTSSVYSDDDNLANRGAVWGFLRWAADHRATPNDADTWRLLVNSTTTGFSNLQNVFGNDIAQQIRDYATSLFADDVPGVTEPRALQPSWNWRSVLPFFDPAYPLKEFPLASGTPQPVTLDGGGSACFRFTVPAGATASVTWTSTTGAGVNWALVRSR